MSYYLYNTEGIILSSNLAGESNRFYHVYTKELGLVGIWGQGVRKLESKLRFHLQDFSRVRVHLVRGKHMWRLTDVDHVERFSSILESFDKRILIGNMSALLKRLLDEEADEELYALVTSAFEYLEVNELDKEELLSFEVLFVLRLLHHLGYGEERIPENISRSTLWNREVFDAVHQRRAFFAHVANKSLQQTHM